jgi:hypothetical protein
MTSSSSQPIQSIAELVPPTTLDEMQLANVASNFSTLVNLAGIERIRLRGSVERFLLGIDLDFFRQCLAGNDLDRLLQFTLAAQNLLAKIEQCPKPVMAPPFARVSPLAAGGHRTAVCREHAGPTRGDRARLGGRPTDRAGLGPTARQIARSASVGRNDYRCRTWIDPIRADRAGVCASGRSIHDSRSSCPAGAPERLPASRACQTDRAESASKNWDRHLTTCSFARKPAGKLGAGPIFQPPAKARPGRRQGQILGWRDVRSD